MSAKLSSILNTNTDLPQPVGPLTIQVNGCFHGGSMITNDWLFCDTLIFILVHVPTPSPFLPCNIFFNNIESNVTLFTTVFLQSIYSQESRRRFAGGMFLWPYDRLLTPSSTTYRLSSHASKHILLRRLVRMVCRLDVNL